jgi:hypothetical protein
MSRVRIPWVLFVLAAVVLAGVIVMLGLNLLPSSAEATERGTTSPLILVWTMILVSVGSAATLAGYLVSVGTKGKS